MNRTIRLISIAAPLVIWGVACCTKAPEEVVNAQQLMNEAKSAEAEVYAADAYNAALSEMDRANKLVEDKECREAKKLAAPLSAKAKNIKDMAAKAKANALSAAKSAAEQTDAAKAKANAANASKYASDALSAAGTAHDAANASMSAGSNYFETKSLYNSATAKYNSAADAAVMAKKAEEEEARRKAAEEEARRLEMLKRFPPEHVVEKGESLWRISSYEKIYNDPFQWPVIFDANTDQIKDPDLIHPGQTLAIPRNVAADKVEAAIKTARNRRWTPTPGFLTDGQ